MGRMAGFLISGTHPRARWGAVLFFWTLLTVLIITLVASERIAQNIGDELGDSLATFGKVRADAVTVFDAMDTDLTDAPCSPAFLAGMRRIAFAPNGFNELLYAPGGIVQCSVNTGALAEPLDLGQPDLEGADTGISMRLDRDLTSLGLDGLKGTIAQRGDHAIIIPPQYSPLTGPDWLEQELVYNLGERGWLHRLGTEGINAAALELQSPFISVLTRGALFNRLCDATGEFCVSGRAMVGTLLARHLPAVSAILLVICVLSAWLTRQSCRLVRRYWSFEERFLRRFDKGSVICAYQPLLNLRQNRITGCEVLARWRDVDGTIVPPDRFIPIIQKHGLSERFTAMVVAYAYADLAPRLPQGMRMQVNFNIFPRDLSAEKLIALFAPFLAENSPFDVVVELVETDEVSPETAMVEIDSLRAAGIRIYVDDFGSGYSSMHTLASISLDGVKLDRSFAMAAENSVMDRMLDHAIDLAHAVGRVLVVEGVETRERLEALRAGGKVDFAQGYFIAKPLLIDAFIAVLDEEAEAEAPLLVA